LTDIIKQREDKIKNNKEPKKTIKELRCSTGSTLLDLALGGAKDQFGLPYGRFINIVGDTSTGKTLTSLEIIANAVYEDKNVKHNYDAAESGNTFNTKKMWNFDLNETYRSRTVQGAYRNINKFCKELKDDEKGIYILDSLDGLCSAEDIFRAQKKLKEKSNNNEYENKESDEKEKGSYHLDKQKFLSNTFFPSLTPLILKKNVMVIIISQVRDNIGVMFGAKHTRSGGKALEFFCSVIYWLAVTEKAIAEERFLGATVKVNITKNRVERSNRKVLFTYSTQFGVDDITTSLDFLYDFRTPLGKLKGSKTKPNMITYEGVEYAREDFILFVEENNLEGWLKEQVINKWEEIEESVLVDRKQKYI